MFQRRRNYILKGATFKGKNMLPIGSIFFPLIVSPMRIENVFSGHLIEKPQKLSKFFFVFKIPKFAFPGVMIKFDRGSNTS